MPAKVEVLVKWNKLYDHMNSGVAACHSPLVPATIGALARILTNREEEPKRREEYFFPVSLRVFEHSGTLPRGDG